METDQFYHYDKEWKALTVYQLPELSATKTGSIFGAKYNSVKESHFSLKELLLIVAI